MIEKIFKEHLRIVEDTLNFCSDDLSKISQLCHETAKAGQTIFFCGNGGSAADAQHLAAEFVGRFQTERSGLPAIALTTDTSILTSVANDYQFEMVFARQVQALTKSGDIVVGISTSGNSPNVVKAIEVAKEKGATTVGMTGQKGGRLAELCDFCLKVPSNVTARIQETHILMGHIICQMVDEGDTCV